MSKILLGKRADSVKIAKAWRKRSEIHHNYCRYEIWSCEKSRRVDQSQHSTSPQRGWGHGPEGKARETGTCIAHRESVIFKIHLFILTLNILMWFMHLELKESLGTLSGLIERCKTGTIRGPSTSNASESIQMVILLMKWF